MQPPTVKIIILTFITKRRGMQASRGRNQGVTKTMTEMHVIDKNLKIKIKKKKIKLNKEKERKCALVSVIQKTFFIRNKISIQSTVHFLGG